MRGPSAARTPSFSASLQTPTLRGGIADGYEVNVPGVGQVLLTRRHFLYGAAGVAALALAGAGGYAFDQMTGNDLAVSTLSVPEDAVFTTEDCELIENSANAMGLVTQKELPYGTLVFANDDTWAACLIPTEEAKPLTQVGLLSLTSGSLNVLVKRAVSEDEGFEIYDVRACSNGLTWTEANIMDGFWRVYSATTDGGSIGEPVLVDEGDANWEMPTIAATAGHSWWQVIPRLDGEMKTENSKLKRAPFGIAQAQDVYLSEGRMCTPIYAMAEGVVITPRAKASGTYYQLTYVDAAGAVADTMVLPQSMKPLEVGYGATGFSFAFDGIYNYGGGIANLGTYAPATAASTVVAPKAPEPAVEADSAGADGADGADGATEAAGAAGADETATENTTKPANNSKADANAPASTEELTANISTNQVNSDAYSAVNWFRFPRTPVCAPAWCGKWFIVKSTSAVCGIDFESRQYFTLEVKSGSDSYGDYLATTGSHSRIVTFSNIDYEPLEGEAQKCCLVRVWSAV